MDYNTSETKRILRKENSVGHKPLFVRWLLDLFCIHNGSRETISELINRLKRYDDSTHLYQTDFPSLPHAIQMVLKLFPHRYCNDKVLKEKILRAFVTTVIPGSDPSDENLVKMYTDEYYAFHDFCGFFVFDLNRRSKRLFVGKEFITLTADERAHVIQDALSGGELTRRLYKGAILMAQVSYFGAIYDEERGCPLIEFPGRNTGYNREQSAYPFSESLFEKEVSLDGHPW